MAGKLVLAIGGRPPLLPMLSSQGSLNVLMAWQLTSPEGVLPESKAESVTFTACPQTSHTVIFINSSDSGWEEIAQSVNTKAKVLEGHPGG